jgi:hypothetical protein
MKLALTYGRAGRGWRNALDVDGDLSPNAIRLRPGLSTGSNVDIQLRDGSAIGRIVPQKIVKACDNPSQTDLVGQV